MEITKQNKNFLEIISRGTEKVNVDADIIVPDTKSDVIKVLQLDASALITNREIINQGVLVEGKLNVNILYLPEDKEEGTGTIRASFDFRDRFEVGDIDDSMKLRTKVTVSKIDFTLLNSRKLSIKAHMNVDYRILGDKDIDFSQNVSDDNAECKFETVSFDSILVDEECEFIVRDSMEIPQGKSNALEVLKIDAKICQREMKVVSDKLIVKGVMGVNALYKNSENQLDFIDGEFPFTEVFDVSSINEEDNLLLELDVCDIQSDISNDSDGDSRIIRFEALLIARVTGSKRNEMDILCDCYIPNKKTEVTYNTIKMKNCSLCVEDSNSIKETINHDSKMSPIVKIYNIIPEVDISKVEKADNNINVTAKLSLYIMYLGETDGNSLFTRKYDIDISYSQNCECGDNSLPIVSIFIDKISYNITASGSIEYRCSVNYRITCCSVKNINNIQDITVTDRDNPNEIIVYFVKDGDSLWSIGKKYATSVDRIKKINNLQEDTIYPRQKLVIPL